MLTETIIPMTDLTLKERTVETKTRETSCIIGLHVFLFPSGVHIVKDDRSAGRILPKSVDSGDYGKVSATGAREEVIQSPSACSSGFYPASSPS